MTKIRAAYRTPMTRLAVMLDQPCWYDGKEYTASHVFWSLATSFSKYFDEVIVFAPCRESQSEKGHFPLLIDKKVRIIGLPFYDSISSLYKNAYKIMPRSLKIFHENMSAWDVAWIVDPFLHYYPFYLLSKWKSKKVFLYLRINPVAFSYQYHSSGARFLGYVFGKTMESFFLLMLKNTLTFTVGKELYEKYRRKGRYVHEFHANLISEKDLRRDQRPPHSSSAELRLLSVGRIVAQKGLKYLVHAVDDLVNNRKMNIRCWIVGEGKDEDNLKKLIVERNLSDRFVFLGFVPWGNELLDVYSNCDIFVLPSLSEGVPKTLFEALSMGIPVVATPVGGIGSILVNKHNGILINPGSSIELSDGIYTLYSDPGLRERVVRNGLDTAREYTREKQQERMVDLVRSHFGME